MASWTLPSRRLGFRRPFGISRHAGTWIFAGLGVSRAISALIIVIAKCLSDSGVWTRGKLFVFRHGECPLFYFFIF